MRYKRASMMAICVRSVEDPDFITYAGSAVNEVKRDD